MLGTLGSFSLMAVSARELSGEISTFQILFFRSLIGLAFILPITLYANKRSLFYTRRLTQHSLRNIFHFFGQYGWFLGIGLLPLAEVFALEFTVPFWTAIIAAVFLKERLSALKAISILLGLAGVIIILQPSSSIFQPSSFIVLGAAICYAVSHTSTKSLTKTETPLTILLFMCVIQLPIGLLLSLQDWRSPDARQLLLLTLIGVTALTAHYCMSKAMQISEVSIVVTLDFFRLPLIATIGVLLYQETFNYALIAGALVMLGANILNMYNANQQQKTN